MAIMCSPAAIESIAVNHAELGAAQAISTSGQSRSLILYYVGPHCLHL